MGHFKVADIVKCINNTPHHQQTATMPALDRTYTVESIRPVDGGFSIRLVELVPDCWQGGPCECGNCGWDAARFRKVPRVGDSALDVFRAMLGGVRELVD